MQVLLEGIILTSFTSHMGFFFQRYDLGNKSKQKKNETENKQWNWYETKTTHHIVPWSNIQ